ncbi:Uncharacterised protein [Mycobacteroides abscessus subsp. abscessus]|nr:Uncharacterised protein [Mycobacteroides abscessus subsp. abscessus]
MDAEAPRAARSSVMAANTDTTAARTAVVAPPESRSAPTSVDTATFFTSAARGPTSRTAHRLTPR